MKEKRVKHSFYWLKWCQAAWKKFSIWKGSGRERRIKIQRREGGGWCSKVAFASFDFTVDSHSKPPRCMLVMWPSKEEDYDTWRELSEWVKWHTANCGICALQLTHPNCTHTAVNTHTHREHTPGAVGSHLCCGAQGDICLHSHSSQLC